MSAFVRTKKIVRNIWTNLCSANLRGLYKNINRKVISVVEKRESNYRINCIQKERDDIHIFDSTI